MVSALDLVAGWPGSSRGLIVLHDDGHGALTRATVGDLETPFEWASVTKVATALCAMVAVDEGLITLEDEVGPPGSTVRHLLAHASGVGPDSPMVLCAPATRRIYSNAGFELLASHLERWSGSSIEALVDETVLTPLGMAETRLTGSPASGMLGPVGDLALLLAETMAPTLLGDATATAMRTVQWPALAGVLPGVGRYDPCAWGLGLEVKGHKEPHWTGSTWGPATVGHFGRAGGFLVVDPSRSLGVVSLGDEPFGAWALEAWPPLLDALEAGDEGGR